MYCIHQWILSFYCYRYTVNAAAKGHVHVMLHVPSPQIQQISINVVCRTTSTKLVVYSSGGCTTRMTNLITASDEFIQSLDIHARYPRHDPAGKWERMSVNIISNPAEMKCKGLHSHGKATGKLQLHRDLSPVLIERFQNHEHGQDLSHCRPYRRVCKMSPNTDTSTITKRNVFKVIGFEGSIIIEESFWEECMWIRVF